MKEMLPVRLLGREMQREREREDAYVMKEVRASVCSASALRATSRYPGTLATGRRIELLGLTDGRDGSNASMSSMGVTGREGFGVIIWVFALESQVARVGVKCERDQSPSDTTKIRSYIASQYR